MKYLPLIWATLWRKKLRTTLTLLSIVIAFLLFGALRTLDAAFSNPAAAGNAGMLVTANKYSVGLPLPMSGLQQIRSTPGVKDATWFSVFGAYYQEPTREVPAVAIDPDSYFKVYADEVSVPADVLAAFTARRNAMLVGVGTASLHGWKVGDRVTLRSTRWPQQDGSLDWTFEVAGLVDGKEASTRAGHASLILVRHDYFDEARAYQKGTATAFIETIDDAGRGAQVSAAIDAKFANSPHETDTHSAKEFAVLLLKQVGDISLIMRAILGAVFFTLLFMTGNTMMQAVRERANEMAVLKALGFTNAKVMGFVVAEAVLVCVIGAAIGLALSYLMLPVIQMTLQGIDLPVHELLPGLAFAVLLALVTSVLPGMRALRLQIVDALSGKQ